MTEPRDRPAPADRAEEPDLRVRQAVRALRDAIRDAKHPGPGDSRGPASLAPGGLILLTEDGGGVARAVAADLKALGYPVARVRHGVGRGEVEGVNLASSAAVAALIDRLRVRGPLAGIVHASTDREGPAANNPPASWDAPDEARTLGLLAQASADDLKASAARGGACLVVARDLGAEAPVAEDRLARWVEISARSLAGVRVRSVDRRPGADSEVFAAEVVRAVLGTDGARPRPERSARRPRPEPTRPASEALLLGSPDRASWILLASSLADWLDEAVGVRLVDVGWTLHRGQPDFPFRVGLVARSAPELAASLRRMIDRLANPSCHAVVDWAGAYWSDSARRASGGGRRDQGRFGGRLVRFARSWEMAGPSADPEVCWPSTLPEWTGRDWLCHLIASRFARGARIRAASLLLGRPASTLDLTSPPSASPSRAGEDKASDGGDALSCDVIEALDDVLALRREAALSLLAEAVGP